MSAQLLSIDGSTIESSTPVPTGPLHEPAALFLINAGNLVWWLQTLTYTDDIIRNAILVGSERRLKSLLRLDDVPG
jgi:hypothetical protein